MKEPTVVIKKYGNRRLYDTENSRYITLNDLAQMIQSGRDVRVVDDKSGADLTKGVLLQIISEQEKDADMLPVSFLKNVIKYSDAAIREPLHRYLTFSLDSFLQAQRQFEQQYRQVAGGLLNPMSWMMNPMNMGQQGPAPGFPGAAPMAGDTPEAPPAEAAPPPAEEAPPAPEPVVAAEAPAPEAGSAELELLKQQMAQMQQMMAQLVDDKKK